MCRVSCRCRHGWRRRQPRRVDGLENLGGSASAALGLQLGQACLEVLLACEHTAGRLATVRVVQRGSYDLWGHLERRVELSTDGSLALALQLGKLVLALGCRPLLQEFALHHAIARRAQWVLQMRRWRLVERRLLLEHHALCGRLDDEWLHRPAPRRHVGVRVHRLWWRCLCGPCRRCFAVAYRLPSKRLLAPARPHLEVCWCVVLQALHESRMPLGVHPRGSLASVGRPCVRWWRARRRRRRLPMQGATTPS